jgi:hypothetical protein
MKLFIPYNSKFKVKGKVVVKDVTTKSKHLFIKYFKYNLPLEIESGGYLIGTVYSVLKKDLNKIKMYNNTKLMDVKIGKYNCKMFVVSIHSTLPGLRLADNKEGL